MIAVIVALKSAVAWFAFSFQLVPDASYYVSGGVKLFPSLPGTALGNTLGWNGLAIANSIAAGLCVYLAGVMAARANGSRIRACIAAAILPLATIFPMYVSIDTLALAIFLGAVVLIQEKRERLGMATMIGAAAFHLALLPIVAIYPLGVRTIQRWMKVAIVAVVFLLGMVGLMTEYGHATDNPNILAGLLAGLLSAGIALVLLGPALLDLNIETRALSWAFFASLFGGIAAAAAMSGGDSTHINMRYFVPATFVAAALYGSRKRTHGTI